MQIVSLFVLLRCDRKRFTDIKKNQNTNNKKIKNKINMSIGNKLPDDVPSCENLSLFKHKLLRTIVFAVELYLVSFFYVI